jgi:integral membrane sensor domain MASE1
LVRALKYTIQLAAVGMMYFFIVRFSLELVAVYPGANAIWPPTGFALAAVLLGGYWVAPAVLVGAYAANAISLGPSYAAAAAAVGNAFIAIAGGFLLNWLAGGRNAFAAPAATAKFVLIAIFIAAISATVGSCLALDLGTSTRIEQVDWQKFASIWFAWWLGDLAAVLVITPALVLWVTDWPPSLDIRRFLESIAILATASAFGAVALTLAPGFVSAAPLAIVAVLLLLWAALRGGPRVSATAALILVAFGIGGIILRGPLVGGIPERSPSLLIIFLIGTATPSLILATDAAQRKRAERILRDTRKELGKAREQFAQSQKMEAVVNSPVEWRMTLIIS